jgi:polyisoprenoid-binding protein YceI
MTILPNRQIIGAALTLTLLLHASGSAQRGAVAKSKLFTIASAQSEITVFLAQEGLISKRHPNHRVAVKAFSGSVQLPPDESKVSVTVTAEAKSLVNVDKTMGDFERSNFQDVLHKNVLESARFTTIRFSSVSVADIRTTNEGRNFTLNGDLTLRSVTKRISVPVSVVVKDKQLRATGEAKFKQTDFGMKPYVGGLGTIRIGDEVRVSFTIIATAQ